MDKQKRTENPPSQEDYEIYMSGGPTPASIKPKKPETIEDVHEHPEDDAIIND